MRIRAALANSPELNAHGLEHIAWSPAPLQASRSAPPLRVMSQPRFEAPVAGENVQPSNLQPSTIFAPLPPSAAAPLRIAHTASRKSDSIHVGPDGTIGQP
jgi:hypothetical protein